MSFNFSDEQEAVICSNYEENQIVSACAGSGKTTVLIERLKNHSNYLLENKSLKKLVVLTFTNNSKNDIILRFNAKNMTNISITTFHGFVISEILPFSNLFTMEQRKEGLVFKNDYTKKFTNITDWKLYLKQNLIIGTSNSALLDFLLEYCLEILSTSQSCRQYLASKYSTIYIDEAQDNNKIQYKYVDVFRTLDIKLFLVGDPNQTIYTFRGAQADLFNQLVNNTQFINHNLTRNYRCNNLINEMALEFQIPENSNFEENVGGYLIYPNSRLDEILNHALQYGNVCYLRSINDDVSLAQQYGYKVIKKPEFINEEPNGEMIDLILKCYYDTKNEFELSSVLQFEGKKKILSQLRTFFNSPNVGEFNKLCNIYFECVSEVLCSPENIEDLISMLEDQSFINYYTFSEQDKVAMTIHTSKGLEFDFVIIKESDYYSYGTYRRNEFYVACTRARKWLIIIK